MFLLHAIPVVDCVDDVAFPNPGDNWRDDDDVAFDVAQLFLQHQQTHVFGESHVDFVQRPPEAALDAVDQGTFDEGRGDRGERVKDGRERRGRRREKKEEEEVINEERRNRRRR